MRRDVSLEAEQAVLGAVMLDPPVLDGIADLFRPAVFAAHPAHCEIAEAILRTARTQAPIDPFIIGADLEPRGVPAAFVLDLVRAIGTPGNVRHYALSLQSLWARREAKKAARELLGDESDTPGAELVASFARRLSAIETANAKEPRILGELVWEELDRLNREMKGESVVEFIPTGFRLLDVLLGGGVNPGFLTTIGARPGVGKSALVAAMADNFAAHQFPVCIFQLEDYGNALARRAISRRAKINSSLLADGRRWTRDTWDKANTWLGPTLDLPIYVDDQHGRTVHDICGAMRRMARQKGVKVFILDNLAEVVVDAQDRADERLDRALGRIAKQYRDTAAALGAVPILVAHLNRESAKGDREPRLTDLKNSGELEDASHVVLLAHRWEEEPTVFQLDAQKNRNGPKGKVRLRWMDDWMAVAEPREGM